MNCWSAIDALRRVMNSAGVVHAASFVTLLAVLTACGGGPATRDPRFDWFEYRGADSAHSRRPAGSGEYHNPVLAGFHPDPSITRVGDEFYLVTSSFAYFPGVPIFRSRDLVHWTQLGHVLNRPSQLNLDTLGVSRGVFAPTIRHHDATFYLITTLVDGGGNFMVTASDAGGPWSEPAFLGFDGIDPDLFFDDDGRAYILNNGPPDETPRYEGHRAIWVQEFDPTARKLMGPRRVIVNGGVDLSRKPIWIEAPHVFKVNGWYYLICAEGGTADQHSEVAFRSRSIWGPFVPFAGNPILTQRHLSSSRPDPVTSAGHADFVRTAAGAWWAVFLGTRPYEADLFNTGRETFLLPVTWRDGWPVILTGEATVPYTHQRPSLPVQDSTRIPTSGSFTYRDEFSDTLLGPEWQFLRTPRETWHDLRSVPGSLTIRARPVPLSGRMQPSFLARRQQHLRAGVSTAMRYTPQADGDQAGLVAFQNDQYYFFLGVALVDGRRMIVLERHAGDSLPPGRAVIASAEWPLEEGTTVYLHIDARGRQYDFAWGLRPEERRVLRAGVDGSILSTSAAGGFVGAMFGLFAYASTR